MLNRTTVRCASVATALTAACMLTVGTAALASARPSDSGDIVPQRFTADSGVCRLGVTSGTVLFVFPDLNTVKIKGEVVDRVGSRTAPCQEDGHKSVAIFTGLSRGERVDSFAKEVDNGRLTLAEVLSSVDQRYPSPIDTVRIQVCRRPVIAGPSNPVVCGEPLEIRARIT